MERESVGLQEERRTKKAYIAWDDNDSLEGSEKEEIFRQEGWHYEIADRDDEQGYMITKRKKPTTPRSWNGT